MANDILQKAKSTENARLLKAFQPQMPDMVSLICETNTDRPLFKEILKVSWFHKVLKLWRDRQVYPETFMNGMIAELERTMQEQKKVTKDELPVITFDVDDLYSFAHNKKQLDIWTEKVKEVKTQLDIMFKNSSFESWQRPTSPKRSSSRSRSCKRPWRWARSTG